VLGVPLGVYPHLLIEGFFSVPVREGGCRVADCESPSLGKCASAARAALARRSTQHILLGAYLGKTETSAHSNPFGAAPSECGHWYLWPVLLWRSCSLALHMARVAELRECCVTVATAQLEYASALTIWLDPTGELSNSR